MQLVNERGWRSGFANMLRKENGTWWKTKKWWVQTLVWLLAGNGLVAFILWVIPLIDPGGAPPASELIGVFMGVLGAAGTVGVLILAQNIIVKEKQMGTAAWILSNPVSRVAFVLSKLLVHGLNILAIIIVLQGAVGYMQISLGEGVFFPLGPFVAAMGLQALNLLFYLTLSLMLGTLFRSRGPVTGIAIGVWFLEQLLGQILGLVWEIFPLLLPSKLVEMASPVALGQPLPSLIPIVSVSLMSLVFVLVALWRFGREEF
jgi:ABC-2 type transport system permease protein